MYHFSGWLSFFYIQLGNYQNDNDTGSSRLRATAKNFKMTIYRKENHRSPFPSLDQAVVSRLLWIWSNVMEPKNIVEHCYYTCQNIVHMNSHKIEDETGNACQLFSAGRRI